MAWSKALNSVTRACLLPALPGSFHFLHRFPEIVGRLELPVDRGEADVGDLVELGELAHHEVADTRGGHLALAERAQPLDHAVDRALDLVRGDRALSQREHHAADQLVAVEVRAAAILLDQARHLQVDAFIGREALFAPGTFAPPARGVRFQVRPGVDHLGLLGATEGASHRSVAAGLVLNICLTVRITSISPALTPPRIPS